MLGFIARGVTGFGERYGKSTGSICPGERVLTGYVSIQLNVAGLVLCDACRAVRGTGDSGFVALPVTTNNHLELDGTLGEGLLDRSGLAVGSCCEVNISSPFIPRALHLYGRQLVVTGIIAAGGLEGTLQLECACVARHLDLAGCSELEADITVTIATQAIGCGGQVAEALDGVPCSVNSHLQFVINTGFERKFDGIGIRRDSCRIPSLATQIGISNQLGVTCYVELRRIGVNRGGGAGLDPDRIAVARSFLGKSADCAGGFVAKLEHYIAGLSDDSGLVAAVVSIYILDLTLGVHACEVTSVDHRFDLILVSHPVGVEYARHTRHREDIRVGL